MCCLSFVLQVLLSEARVLGLGPRFMSIYVQKLAVSSGLPLQCSSSLPDCIIVYFLFNFYYPCVVSD